MKIKFFSIIALFGGVLQTQIASAENFSNISNISYNGYVSCANKEVSFNNEGKKEIKVIKGYLTKHFVIGEFCSDVKKHKDACDKSQENKIKNEIPYIKGADCLITIQGINFKNSNNENIRLSWIDSDYGLKLNILANGVINKTGSMGMYINKDKSKDKIYYVTGEKKENDSKLNLEIFENPEQEKNGIELIR